jgi:hypothetical protein
MSSAIPPRPAQSRKEKKRLLHRRPGFALPDSEGLADYTEELHKAMYHEPEAVDEFTAARFADENRRRFDALRTREVRQREHRTLQNHLREFCRAAAESDLDPVELDQIRTLIAIGRRRMGADVVAQIG